LQTGAPTVVPRIDITVDWPGFRNAAHWLGLRTSLSIPVFAGRGGPMAALNLYGRNAARLAPLSAAVLAAYDCDSAGAVSDGLGPGALQLLDGLVGAFSARATIQQAIGVIMTKERTNADFAYTILRSRATTTASSLTDAAGATVRKAGGQATA
jgi:hypothetical protein